MRALMIVTSLCIGTLVGVIQPRQRHDAMLFSQ